MESRNTIKDSRNRSVSFDKCGDALNPLAVRGIALFIFAAAVGFTVLAVLKHADVMNSLSLWQFGSTYSPWQFVPIRLWVAAAALIGLVFPIVAMLLLRRHREVHQVFFPYVLVLAVQIGLEIGFRHAGFPEMSIPIGLVFTAYRICQLVYALRFLRAATFVDREVGWITKALLIVGLSFWSLNLLFLSFSFI